MSSLSFHLNTGSSSKPEALILGSDEQIKSSGLVAIPAAELSTYNAKPCTDCKYYYTMKGESCHNIIFSSPAQFISIHPVDKEFNGYMKVYIKDMKSGYRRISRSTNLNVVETSTVKTSIKIPSQPAPFTIQINCP